MKERRALDALGRVNGKYVAEAAFPPRVKKEAHIMDRTGGVFMLGLGRNLEHELKSAAGFCDEGICLRWNQL